MGVDMKGYREYKNLEEILDNTKTGVVEVAKIVKTPHVIDEGELLITMCKIDNLTRNLKEVKNRLILENRRQQKEGLVEEKLFNTL